MYKYINMEIINIEMYSYINVHMYKKSNKMYKCKHV